jgi:hypothetical protein
LTSFYGDHEGRGRVNTRNAGNQAQSAPKSDLVCSQNGAIQTIVQRLDHPNGAKAVATNENAIGIRRYMKRTQS